MNINAVITSVNYSDMLSWSLPSCRNCFNKLIVVTSKADEKTRNVCKYWHVECLSTDIFYKDGAKFNKGLGIQLGLDYLNSKDFVVHMDSDIILPPRFNDFIRSKNYNKDCLYGIDRLDVKDWDTWINFYINPVPQHYVGSTWANPGMPLMYRVTQQLNYSPVGYFQMWHSQSKFAKGGYPISSNNAADSDLRFAEKWPAENRVLIPEVFVYHLSTENSTAIGTNWEGRKSRSFGPKENS